MAVHDGESFLDEAIASIRAQTLVDFELIVVDDGSRDRTAELLEAAQSADPRIRVVRNERNLGLAASLNRAIAVSRGRYLARMDGDDIASPHRFERQVARLEAEPGLAILGSNATHISATGAVGITSDLPLDHAVIRGYCLFRNPFVHPSVMLRAASVRTELRYDESYSAAQDWELWTRLLSAHRGANLAEPLIKLRKHEGSISARRRDRQVENGVRLIVANAARILGNDAVGPADARLLLLGFSAGDRAAADRNGVDRVDACQLALDLLRRLRRRHPDRCPPELDRRITRSCLAMGLGPPLRPGAGRLALRLLTERPSRIGTAVGRLCEHLAGRAEPA